MEADFIQRLTAMLTGQKAWWQKPGDPGERKPHRNRKAKRWWRKRYNQARRVTL
jgi:hypothetical protein